MIPVRQLYCQQPVQVFAEADINTRNMYAGVDVNLKNTDTALIVATLKGSVDIVEILVSAGADVNIGKKNGSPSLRIAVRE